MKQKPLLCQNKEQALLLYHLFLQTLRKNNTLSSIEKRRARETAKRCIRKLYRNHLEQLLN